MVAETDLSEQVKRRDELETQEKKYWKEYSKYKREVIFLFLEGFILDTTP